MAVYNEPTVQMTTGMYVETLERLQQTVRLKPGNLSEACTLNTGVMNRDYPSGPVSFKLPTAATRVLAPVRSCVVPRRVISGLFCFPRQSSSHLLSRIY
jgi:hypothetical protein